MTNKELLSNFEKLVTDERRITKAVLEHIAEIESRKAYLDLGYEGMYAYLTKGLGYSEGAAYRRLQSARVLRSKPEIAIKIESGSLNLMQLTEVAKICRNSGKEISSDILNKLESKSKSATEQILAEAFNLKPQIATNTKTQKDHSVRLEITFSKEQFEELLKAKSLLSHICPDGTWPEIFTELAKRHTKKFEQRSTKALSATEKNPPTTPPVRRQRAVNKLARPYLNIHLKRQIISRSNGLCEHLDPRSGRRCNSSYQPQIDHIHPISKGGENHIHNLQLLCASHNRAKGSSTKTLDILHPKRESRSQ